MSGPLSTAIHLAFIAIVLVVTIPDRTLAVVALSFWHYYVYWLAFRYRVIPLAEFRRDAIFLKTLALLAFGSVYLAAPLHWLSFAVVAGGFLLNVLAARVLGSDRTYFGHELAGLPHLKVTAFPYSFTSHPMLLGNIAAFGGTLLNAGFRKHWWPLAAAHVALNLGVLIMELTSQPQPPRRPPRLIGALVTIAGAALGATCAVASHHTSAGIGVIFGAFLAVYAFVIWLRYSSPAARITSNL